MNQVAAGLKSHPAFANLANNKFMLVWNAQATNYAIRYAIFDALSLTNLSGDLFLSSAIASTPDQITPACSPLLNQIVCTWQGHQSGNWAPYGAYLNATDGSVTKQDLNINAPIAGTDQTSPVSIDLGGSPFVFWENGVNVYGVQLSSVTGNPTSTPIKFNINSVLPANSHLGATTATDGTGVVVWGSGGGSPQVYLSALSSSLSITEQETQISPTTFAPGLPAVTSVPGGGLFATMSNTGGFLGVTAANQGTTSATMSTTSTTTTPAGHNTTKPAWGSTLGLSVATSLVAGVSAWLLL
jgi:hypothetical protein